MDADDVGAFQNGGGDRRHRSVQTFRRGRRRAGFAGEYAADERLSRCANQDRILGKSSDQLIEARDQLEVLFLTLTKPDTRIDHDRLARTPRRSAM